MSTNRTWQILLIGGASGVGKTSVSYNLAQHFGVGITEVDDFQVILERMTRPEDQPVLHYWRLHPEEAQRMNEEQQLAFMLSYSRIMSQALELVIANHLRSGPPIVLEGDFILPELAVQHTYDGTTANGQVQAMFVYEESEAQIRANYLARENKDQPARARASWRHSEWLRQEAERLGLAAVPARPWTSTLSRAQDVLKMLYSAQATSTDPT